MALERKTVRPTEPGYFPKNQVRYRYCNDFHDEGLRCTRQMGHKWDGQREKHAAHVTMGVENSTEEVRDKDTGELIEIRVKPGMKNTEDVQIATW